MDRKLSKNGLDLRASVSEMRVLVHRRMLVRATHLPPNPARDDYADVLAAWIDNFESNTKPVTAAIASVKRKAKALHKALLESADEGEADDESAIETNPDDEETDAGDGGDEADDDAG